MDEQLAPSVVIRPPTGSVLADAPDDSSQRDQPAGQQPAPSAVIGPATNAVLAGAAGDISQPGQPPQEQTAADDAPTAFSACASAFPQARSADARVSPSAGERLASPASLAAAAIHDSETAPAAFTVPEAGGRSATAVKAVPDVLDARSAVLRARGHVERRTQLSHELALMVAFGAEDEVTDAIVDLATYVTDAGDDAMYEELAGGLGARAALKTQVASGADGAENENSGARLLQRSLQRLGVTSERLWGHAGAAA